MDSLHVSFHTIEPSVVLLPSSPSSILELGLEFGIASVLGSESHADATGWNVIQESPTLKTRSLILSLGGPLTTMHRPYMHLFRKNKENPIPIMKLMNHLFLWSSIARNTSFISIIVNRANYVKLRVRTSVNRYSYRYGYNIIVLTNKIKKMCVRIREESLHIHDTFNLESR